MGELNAALVALAASEAKYSVDIAVARAEYKVTIEAERSTVWVEVDKVVTTAWAKVEKATKDEFGAGFFQGYSDLKRRLALNIQNGTCPPSGESTWTIGTWRPRLKRRILLEGLAPMLLELLEGPRWLTGLRMGNWW